MKTKWLILFGLIVSIRVLYAQTDYKSGYIIKSPGDTLYGKIGYRGDLYMSSICKYKNADDISINYTPNDIFAFRFIDSKYFVSKELNGNKVFMEYLIKGIVNIYYLRDKKGEHYYLDKEDVKLTELPYEEGIKYVDKKQVYYESKKHIGVLRYHMQDAPEIESRIFGLKEPGHQNLIKLAEEYHNAVCDGEECIIYEKSTPLLSISTELIGGVTRYPNLDNVSDKYHFQAGFILHSWMPRTSEKMYFRTGLLFSQLEIDSANKNIFKIPIQLEYIYPKGIIRPRIAYGLNIYIPFDYSVSFNPGANIKLGKSIFLSATSDIEFNPTLLFIPKDLLSYSFHMGLVFKI